MPIDKNHADYQDLKNRIREDPKDFVVIVGAGLSAPAGIPSWSKLRDYLIENAHSRYSEIEADELRGYKAELERLSTTSNLWHCFSELKKILPAHAYTETIVKQLSLEKQSDIPITYDFLWQLGIKGIMTFNLDKCSVGSYARVCSDQVDSATAAEPSRFTRYLSSPFNFVFQPHGIITDPSTWIFTTQERSRLLRNKEYIDFINTIFRTKHVLIIGFNVTDFVFQYLIEQSGIDFITNECKHYAVIPNPPVGTISELSEKGICTIPYSPDDESKHSEIKIMLEDFISYFPTDEIPQIAYDDITEDDFEIPTPEDLRNKPLEEIRTILNKAIAKIMPVDQPSNTEAIETLEKFYSKYIKAIHDSWLVEPNTEYNILHGYKILSSVGRGAFGQVYEVESIESGERAAVKILLPEIKNKRDYLNSFRRGVSSMKILTQKDVVGMVNHIKSYEIPACVFMEYIDGPTLDEAKQWGILNNLDLCLKILIDIGHIVHSAHCLDERVLHRDLKPANIILKDFYKVEDDLEVVVLDFDLSWHKGALDVSVVHGARAQGYAAPEQTATGSNAGISTRHTAVDVFGFGMLAYFLFCGEDPRPNAHNFPDFKGLIKTALSDKFNPSWHCLPSYLSDIIYSCTKDIQKDRIGFSEAIDGFKIAFDMISNDTIPKNHPLAILEIAYRIDKEGIVEIQEYGRSIAMVSPDKSKTIQISIVDVRGDIGIQFNIAKVRSETEQRNVGKYIKQTKDRAVSKLNEFPFSKIEGNIGQSRIDILAIWLPPIQIESETIRNLSNIIHESRILLEFK